MHKMKIYSLAAELKFIIHIHNRGSCKEASLAGFLKTMMFIEFSCAKIILEYQQAYFCLSRLFGVVYHILQQPLSNSLALEKGFHIEVAYFNGIVCDGPVCSPFAKYDDFGDSRYVLQRSVSDHDGLLFIPMNKTHSLSIRAESAIFRCQEIPYLQRGLPFQYAYPISISARGRRPPNIRLGL